MTDIDKSPQGGCLLCGTDFSVHARETEEVAALMAKAAGCELLLIDAVAPLDQ